MKRSALKRRTRLVAKKRSYLTRAESDRLMGFTTRKPLRAKGGSRFPKRRDPDYLAWIRTLSCTVRSALCWRGGSDPAHIKTRGSGGDDLNNVVPLCRLHHSEQEGRTSQFEKKHAIDLRAIALQLTKHYLDHVKGTHAW